MIETVFYSGVPLILTALGALYSERAGVLNISLEGCIGAGAFVTALLVAFGIPLILVVPASLMTGILSGLLLAAVHLRLGANLFIAGLGINLLLPSLCSIVSQGFYGHKGIVRISSESMNLLPFLMLPAAALASFILYRSEFGRRIRAVGANPALLTERAVPVNRIRTIALSLSSGLAALAGSILTLKIGAYVPGISSGKGWIALVMVWMGFRHPLGILLAGYVFAFFEIASGRIQGLVAAGETLMLALPYLGALFGLVLLSAGGRGKDS